MTGKINLLNSADSSGFIAADNGARVHFSSSDLFAYDIGRLMVGQMVSFELRDGRGSEAMNVCPHRPHATDSSAQTRAEARSRYLGFEQKGSIRAYQFELILPQEASRTIAIQIDLGLLRLHRIAMQDGPALCRHALVARGLETAPPARRAKQLLLVEQDVTAYQASLPAVNAKRRYGFRRPTPAPAALEA